jgi:putative ABC transport system permease protein
MSALGQAKSPRARIIGVVVAVPWGTFVVLVLLAILAGLVAAALPARRALRLNVLEALQYE